MEIHSYVPDWVTDAIIYHIYPLGFFGCPKRAENEPKINDPFVDIRTYYDYFQRLGINTIQFGPLFESISHGYDTTDYFKIDHRLGTNELFQNIVKELHERGIRVILDGLLQKLLTTLQHPFMDKMST